MDWNNERILVIDSLPESLDAIALIAAEHFPSAEIAKASDRSEALCFCLAAANLGLSYNVVCWNSSLPADADASVAERLEQHLGTQQLNGALLCCYQRTVEGDTQSFSVTRFGEKRDFQRDFLAGVWGCKIEHGIGPLLRAKHGYVPGSGRGSRYCGTHGIADTMRDIKMGWPHIEENLKTLVQSVFSVREVEDEVLVNL